MSLKINIVDPSTIKERERQDEKPLPSMEAVHHPDDRPWIGEKNKSERTFYQILSTCGIFPVRRSDEGRYEIKCEDNQSKTQTIDGV